ncbi:NarK family nitrate/nitrite MFS transporter [Methylonatrum kenyense]|uniref:NarK family nitrate/nitrite MFS transporter n=1 Tax=Methylonatrum kenyense TaxID=455253 RepID=UPI0020BF5C94|nr:NarK family nitrate/nitrite MFS transporter [Methylonatrum kenyense]MCK8515813.1 NarK family nitrate/nitrite MFS transporter [Methylonatrum kenyense]
MSKPGMATPYREGYVLHNWNPEDNDFWQAEGRRIAYRNLWISIPCLLLAFAVWMIWSVTAVMLPQAGFDYTTNQLFWLAALPSLSGATLRVFYSFMVPIFGGRRWTAISTASLLIPAVGIGFAVQNPDTPYWVMITLAILCGFGGGNFASSMSNISFFFPKQEKGTALGLNAGLGNLGVSLMQFVVPLVITISVFGAFGDASATRADGSSLWLQNAGFVWVPFILLATAAAWFGMNDVANARASFAEQAVIFRRKHNWLMCWLYIGTFGSFIGYSAAFPMLINNQFPDIDGTQYAFLGPLIGALIRPVGGWLADKLGGARVTLWNFVVMGLAVLAVMLFLPGEGGSGNFWGFLLAFLVLFATTGVGNGSTFRMIPVIFTNQAQAAAGSDPAAQRQAVADGNKEGAAVLGFSSAIGAYGGFFIPRGFGSSIALTGTVSLALWIFIVFYLSCIAVTWWYYARRGAEAPC